MLRQLLHVSASYPGASAEVIVQTVAMPLEDEINGVEDLLYFSSTSDNSGNYSCSVTFKSGTDTDIAMVNLQNAVKRAEVNLPSDVTKNGIQVRKRGGDILAMFAFISDGTSMNQMELNNYVDSYIKDSISRIDGVSSADVMSSQEYSMRIWLDPLRMAGLGISTSDITAAVEIAEISRRRPVQLVPRTVINMYNYKLNVKVVSLQQRSLKILLSVMRMTAA